MRRRRRIIKKKNEKLTGQYLAELLPNGTLIESQYHIKEVIKDEDGTVIRKWVYVDYAFSHRTKQFFVEFNGTQHYRSTKKWGGKEGLRKQKIRDEWLRKYCLEKGIILIEVDGRKVRGKRIQADLRRQLGDQLQ